VLQADVPFLVPGGRFNEQYGWDSYFIALGLAVSSQPGLVDLVRGTVTQLFYQLKHFGKILNANRSYYFNRSQPPFTTAAAALLPEGPVRDEAMQLARVEYETVWMSGDHVNQETGLNKYGGGPVSLCSAVEPGGYFKTFQQVAQVKGVDVRELIHTVYRGESLGDPQVYRLVADDLAMRDSGHDTTARLADCASVLLPVCLNSLLYKIERDLGLEEVAELRRSKVYQFMWSKEAGYFMDYNYETGRKQRFVSPAGMVYPLWAGLVREEDAHRVRDVLVAHLEYTGGIVGSTEESSSSGHFQWDYPWGWAPHQVMAWTGLMNYGFVVDAQRLAYRWSNLCAGIHAMGQCVPEKLDVVNNSIGVDVEYGSQCLGIREYFGWTAASLVFARHNVLTPEQVAHLEVGTPTELVFDIPESITWRLTLSREGTECSCNTVFTQ
jgi:alpha,alpha-trehalase